MAPSAAPVTAASSPLGACTNGWQEWSVPRSAFESTPFEVVTRAGKPAWVLGGSNSGVLVLRKKGYDWRHVAQRSTGHRGFVGGVALSDSKVLGVGYQRVPELELDPLVGRFAAGSYASRRAPASVNDRAALADVAKAPGGNLWAVGTRLYKGKLMAFASKWNGSRWVSANPASSSGAGLLGVHRTPNGQIWAVGWREINPGRARPLILKRTPSGWKSMAGPPVSGSALLTDIDFRTSKDGWAVGYQIGPGSTRHKAILFHWNGSSWKNVDLPWAGDFAAVPRSVSLGPDGEVWIAGAQLANGNRETRGFIARRVGGDWTVNVLNVPDDLRSEVTDVAATNFGAVAVGVVNGTALVLRSCEDTSIAGAKKGRKIKVSSIAARRVTEPWEYDDSVGYSASGSSSAKRLPSISAAKGFVVRDRTKAAGLKMTTPTYGGFAADLDNNGWKDIFFSRHAKKPPFVALNGPNGLKRINPPTFSSLDRHGCDAADIDKSGARDILCAVGRGRGKQITRHELALDPSEASGSLDRGGAGISDPFGRGREVAFLRLDDDAYPEVFVGSMPSRDDSMPSLNRFYKNEGGTFVPAPQIGLDRAYGAVCSWGGDLDKDGDGDLVYCTAWRTGSKSAGIRIMRNEGGKLRERTSKLGIRPMGDIDVAVADVTGDGRKDIVQLSASRIRVSKWTSNGYVRIYDAAVYAAKAVATGDANGDGRADIYIVRGTRKSQSPDRLLISKDKGRRYSSVAIPQVSKGHADDVFALDWDKNGLADFVVLNGKGPAGPVQLLASYPK